MRLMTAATTAAALISSSAGLTLDIPTATTTVVDMLPHPAQITTGTLLELRDGGGNGLNRTGDGFNKTCARSVYSNAFSRSIPNAELSAALRSSLSLSGVSSRPWRGDLCTVTLASSLSSDYIAYLSQAKSKYTSATDYLKNVHTDCGGPIFQVSVRPVCTKSSLTAVFTGSAAGSSPKTTVLPAVPPNNGVSIDVKTGNVSMINLLADDDKESAASGLGRALGSVVALAVAAAGVALLL